jgi:hypothetical protein
MSVSHVLASHQERKIVNLQKTNEDKINQLPMFLSISVRHPSHSQSNLIRDVSFVNEGIRKNKSANVLIRSESRLGGPFVQLDPDGFVPVIA